MDLIIHYNTSFILTYKATDDIEQDMYIREQRIFATMWSVECRTPYSDVRRKKRFFHAVNKDETCATELCVCVLLERRWKVLFVVYVTGRILKLRGADQSLFLKTLLVSGSKYTKKRGGTFRLLYCLGFGHEATSIQGPGHILAVFRNNRFFTLCHYIQNID